MLDVSTLADLALEEVDQEGSSLRTVQGNRAPPVVAAEEGVEGDLLPGASDEAADGRKGKEDQRLAAREVEQATRERHGGVGVAEGVDEREGRDEDPPALVDAGD